jgi:hypothetical protein
VSRRAQVADFLTLDAALFDAAQRGCFSSSSQEALYPPSSKVADFLTLNAALFDAVRRGCLSSLSQVASYPPSSQVADFLTLDAALFDAAHEVLKEGLAKCEEVSTHTLALRR